MTCLAAESVAGLIAGSLSAEERAEIHAHVDGCESCRRWVAAAARGEPRLDGSLTLPADAVTASAPAHGHVMLAPGTQVDRYVVRDFLGAGAMGVVYSAHDPQLDRAVALKVVHTTAERRAAYLVREAQAMAKVPHPNVVPIYDAGTDRDLVFIAMKQIDGAPLRGYLARTPGSLPDRLGLMCGAGRGLAAAHAAGVVHRDFKPDNVLVEADGTAKVSDFALAGDAADAEGVVAGTPAYMAPEVRRGARATAASDQYSYAQTVAEVLGPRAPGRVRRVLARALAAEPARRFGSVDELVRALERRPRAAPIAIAAAGVASLAVIAALLLGGDGGARIVAAGAACDREADGQLAPALGLAPRLAVIAHAGHARDPLRALDQLDDYGARWATMRQRACRATAVTGEQPAGVRDLRMACLDDRLAELGVVSRQLRTVPPAGAARLASVLGDLDQCTAPNEQTIGSGPRARALRTRLAEAHALAEQGFTDRAEPELGAIIADARAAKLSAIEGEALLASATLLARNRRAGATEELHQALAIAERIGDQPLRADALIALLADASVDRSRDSETTLLAGMIDAALADLPGDQGLRRARTAGNLANFYSARHDYAAAKRSARTAAELFDRELGAGSVYTLMARESLAHIAGDEGNIPDKIAQCTQIVADIRRLRGDDDPMLVQALLDQGVAFALAERRPEAAVAFRTAFELAEKLYGPDHPQVADALRMYGFLEMDGDPRAALAAFTRAVGIVERSTHRSDSPKLVPMLTGLGEAQLATGDATAAVATLERCLALWGDHQYDQHLKPTAKFALARALWDSGGDRVRAGALAREAHDDYIANQGPWRAKADEVTKWQATHH